MITYNIFIKTEGITDATAASYSQVENLIPFLLKFLGDEYDDTSSAVFGFLGSLQGIVSSSFLHVVFRVSRRFVRYSSF